MLTTILDEYPRNGYISKVPEKPIKFHRHAKRRMKERGVTTLEAEETLRFPDCVTSSVKGRLNAFKFLNERHVRATYKELSNDLLVITVVVRKKPFMELCNEDRIQ